MDGIESQAAEPVSESAPSEVVEEAPKQGWDDAFEAYEEAGDTEVLETPKEEEATSHLEQAPTDNGDKGDLDKALDTLPIPHKYKGKVKEFLESQKGQQAELTTAVQEFKQANDSLLGVFKEIAADPNKIVDYVLQYGEQVGLDAGVVDGYKRLKQGRDNSPKNQPQNQEQQKQDVIDAVFKKYGEQLVGATDGNTFLNSLKSMIGETYALSRTETNDLIKQVISGYHEKVVAPDLNSFKDLKSQGRVEANKSMWNNAQNSAKGKFQDFGKYESKVIEIISTDPLFVQHTASINKDPQAAAKSGLTHQVLVEKAYELASRLDHIENAKKKTTWNGGLKPSAKHVTTTKSTSDGWDGVKQEFYPNAD